MKAMQVAEYLGSSRNGMACERETIMTNVQSRRELYCIILEMPESQVTNIIIVFAVYSYT